jgi:hypothetical protein
MEEFGPLLKLDDVHTLFEGERGSMYAHHTNGKTTAYREPSNMPGTGKKLQHTSGRTLYVPDEHVDDMLRIFQNKNIASEMVPSEDGQHLQVKATEPGKNYYTNAKYPEGFKPGDVLASAPVKGKPAVGTAPIELFGSNKSPIGSEGGGVHFGSKITRVLPLGGNSGYRPGVDNLQHSLNPLKMAKGGMIVKPLVGGRKTI